LRAQPSFYGYYGDFLILFCLFCLIYIALFAFFKKAMRAVWAWGERDIENERNRKELEYFKDNLEYVKQQFSFKKIIAFLNRDPKKYDPQNKAAKAKYGKPGIYLE